MNNEELQAEASRIGLTELMDVDRSKVAERVHPDATEEDIDRITGLLQAARITFAVSYQEHSH